MRDQRLKTGWSLARASGAMNHSPTWLANCEGGRIIEPKLATPREIAIAYGVPLSEVRAALALPRSKTLRLTDFTRR